METAKILLNLIIYHLFSGFSIIKILFPEIQTIKLFFQQSGVELILPTQSKCYANIPLSQEVHF